MPKNLSKMSARALEQEHATRLAADSAACNACIAANMGHMRFSDIAAHAKGSSLLATVRIARAYISAHAAVQETYAEMDRRKTYHGSLKPIRKAS